MLVIDGMLVRIKDGVTAINISRPLVPLILIRESLATLFREVEPYILIKAVDEVMALSLIDIQTYLRQEKAYHGEYLDLKSPQPANIVEGARA